MKKVCSRQQRVASTNAKSEHTRLTRAFLRGGLVAAFVIASAILQPAGPQAQRSGEKGANVKDVSTSRKDGETTVSVSGDGAMNRVQTWQDKDGFHVVFPNGKGAPARMPAGVKAQRVGDSLELIVPTKPGASVTVNPRSNRLDLVVTGGMGDDDGAQAQSPAPEKSETQAARERVEVEDRRAQEGAGRRSEGRGDSTGQQREQSAPESGSATRSNEAGAAGQASSNTQLLTPDFANKSPEATAPPVATANAETRINAVTEESSIFSTTSMMLIIALAGGGGLLFFMRRRRAQTDDGEMKRGAARKNSEIAKGEESVEKFELPPFEPYKGDRRKRNLPVAQDRRRGVEEIGQRFSLSDGSLTPEGVNYKIELKSEPRHAGAGVPAVLFGAYRIDQEVSKLIDGLPHSIEVLASRASDDRRAIETSLVKALNSRETDADGMWRVRQALEDYGFVARQSAALLLSTDTYERVSAARTLGRVRSASSLPFLLEALYDNETLVRTEAVSSLGLLGLPKAIGALIDMARRYPEVPASLVAPALTACSFDAQESGWVSAPDSRSFGFDAAGEIRMGEIDTYDSSRDFEQLPEWLEDDNFADALERLGSADVEMRISAAQSLAQFHVKRSVEALTSILARDESPTVRAAAVTSLAAIDHETVFAPVLYALADDAREVRAAAARAYSGFNFDRSNAAAHIVETADHETLEDLARACVKSGVAAQAVNRLASDDRHQAYESFSILSLVVRGGEIKPVVEAIATHHDMGVRLAAVRLASLTGDEQLLGSLRELAKGDGLPAEVRAALSEALEEGNQVPM